MNCCYLAKSGDQSEAVHGLLCLLDGDEVSSFLFYFSDGLKKLAACTTGCIAPASCLFYIDWALYFAMREVIERVWVRKGRSMVEKTLAGTHGPRWPNQGLTTRGRGKIRLCAVRLLIRQDCRCRACLPHFSASTIPHPRFCGHSHLPNV